jgi:UDPglucose--hexose-1-phosphate uridylyltransferase
MATVTLRRETLTAEMLDPREGFRPVSVTVEVRWDPLTGHTSRILPPRGLMPPNDFDLEALARETAARCPFCPDRIDQMTPQLVGQLAPEGRIRQGRAALFPNLHAYGAHSSVAVYDSELHYLPLAQITPRLMADNLATQVAFARAVLTADPSARWISINANHMLPSGSSLFHPHTQGAAEPVPTTMQRLLADVPAERFAEYLAAEREAGERWLGDTGGVVWLASFAPIAPAEIRAFVAGVASPAELSDDHIEELGRGLASVLGLYAELGFESFNLAMYGAPPGTRDYPLNLRIACRSNLAAPGYRSDSTYFERLHWEGAIDITPEEVAERARGRFA